ncbi:MAG: hypothetical protein KAX31_00580, partial [Thermoplasmata archaeon]|nr:hypothetical protein [Thermoplasmata archaeon]
MGRGDLVFINTTINNGGDALAENIDVEFYDDFDGEITTIFTEVIPSLAPGEEFNISFEYSWNSVDDRGIHNISVMVDPDDKIPEMPPDGEDNNEGYLVINVISQPDLAFRYSTDIWFSEIYPIVNNSFDINANVWNIGDIDADNVTVSFYDNTTGTPELLGSDEIDVPANPYISVQATLEVEFAVARIYNILVVIDEDNNIPEVDEDNNELDRSVNVRGPSDLHIDSLVFIHNGELVTEGVDDRTTVTIRADVWNLGDIFETSVRVDFLDVDNGDAVIGTYTIPSIDGLAHEYAQITWEANCNGNGLSWTRTISAVAQSGANEDPGGQSNDLDATITVTDRRPDLQFEDVELLIYTDIPENTRFSIDVNFTNNGDNAAESFSVDVYDGVESDENWLGNRTVAILNSDQYTIITVQCNGLDGLGAHTLIIAVDPDKNATDTVPGYTFDLVGQIEEFNENNNDGTLSVNVVIPSMLAIIDSPTAETEHMTSDTPTDILVIGRVVRLDSPTTVMEGISLTIQIEDSDGNIVGTAHSNVTDDSGMFIVFLENPNAVGTYTIRVSGN